MQKRDLLKSTAAVLGGIATGSMFVHETTQPVHASVSMGGLAITDGETATNDGTITDVQVQVDGNWQYDVPGRKDPKTWQAVLWAEQNGERAVVALDEGSAKYLSSSGTYSLKGSLTNTELYSTGDFQASENGDTTVTTLNLQLVFNVFNKAEDVIAQAELTETADVAVTNKEYSAVEHGSADGSGSVIIID